MSYEKTQWNNGRSPSLSAENLNKMEQGIYDALTVNQATDFNDATTAGMYSINGNTNAPASSVSYWSLVVTCSTYRSTTHIHQVAIPEGGTDVYIRHKNGTTWSAWKKAWTSDNLIVSSTAPAVVNGALWIKY